MPRIDNRNQALLWVAWVWLCSSQVSAGEVVVAQKDRLFQMDDKPVTALSARVGDVIQFRNDDSFFHNVYSASETQTFDLGSYPRGFHRSVALTTPGEVGVECALHSTMKILINVTP
jgi:plastocyanin